MSLVEKAIQKIQKSRADGEPDGGGVFGSVVSTVVHRGVGSERSRAVASRSIQIDLDSLRAGGLLPPVHQERQISAQYRQIKRPLVGKAFGRGMPKVPNGHALMVASAVAGEGKTFTSINLALSMALEKDVRVVLVDADIPKPHVSRLLGVEQEQGLVDVLRDSSLDVENLILGTNVPGLFVLPAGRRVEHATELLASDAMRDLVTRLHDRGPDRIVLFDSPPLLLTTESHSISEMVGQIIIVVRAGVTPHQSILDALSYVEGRSVSLILNQSLNSAPTGYYYYGYGDNARTDSSSG